MEAMGKRWGRSSLLSHERYRPSSAPEYTGFTPVSLHHAIDNPHVESPIDLFSIRNGDDLYSPFRLINNIEYSIITNPYSETFATMKLFGTAGEGIVFQ
jgi:hypothetical protein